MTVYLPLAAASFAIGAIPFGVIVSRLFFRSDIRAAGSGNIGAANALRTYGMGGGAAVLLLDALKGFVPTFLALQHFGSYAAALSAACAVLGHCYSPFLRFRGGKGVATWLGASFGLSWIAGIAFVCVWCGAVIPTRLSSLGSLAATAGSVAVLAVVVPQRPVFVSACIVALVIFWKHRENIGRLARGKERTIGFSGTRKDGGRTGLKSGST